MTITKTGDEAATVRHDAPPAARVERGAGLLCVANFPANTGYAWDYIEGLYGALAERLAAEGVPTWVAYPRIEAPPATLEGSAARAVELDVGFDTPARLAAVLAFVRRHRIRVMYMADRSSWSPAYALLRLAGVRRIVVHDHTSGDRTIPTGVRRMVKQLRGRLPGMLADRVIAVSDFVARRKAAVDLVPARRITRIWNSSPVPPADPGVRERLRAELGIDGEGPVVACVCRATPEKGVGHLLRAFDLCCSSWPPGSAAPTLVYFGDGPAFRELELLRESLPSAARIRLAGYRANAAELVGGADVCVVPSVWQEAFGLAALEPMTRGVPVIASRVGGIPEIVLDRQTGILVNPGDEAELAEALARLLSEPAERRRMGSNGIRRALDLFSPDTNLNQLLDVIEPGLKETNSRRGGR